MKIAVTYENGTIFQHFGKTQQFKLYEAENGQIVSSQVVDTAGAGHEALADFLAQQGVDVVICGGIGGGAQSALSQAGIEICAGAQGNTDEAVAAYLAGNLENAGVTCDHHHQEEGHHCCGSSGEESKEGCGCGSEEEGGCGGNCGGGCGGCGGPMQVILEGKNAGKTVKTHYRGTFNDGTQFDSSYDRGQPLEFVCGTGMMIPGYDAAVVNMEVGDVVDIHLMPEDAYGMPDPNAIFTIPVSELPGSEVLSIGDHVYLANPMGQQFPVVVTAREGDTITFDANHEMAGKELNFHIELVEVQE